MSVAPGLDTLPGQSNQVHQVVRRPSIARGRDGPKSRREFEVYGRSFASGSRPRPIKPFPLCPDCDRILRCNQNREVPTADGVTGGQPRPNEQSDRTRWKTRSGERTIYIQLVGGLEPKASSAVTLGKMAGCGFASNPPSETQSGLRADFTNSSREISVNRNLVRA